MERESIEEFRKLLEVAETLMGPEGCPWDREQTLVSMRESVLEEACEVIEAIDEGNHLELIEELGDLLYNVIFFCFLGEKEGIFTTQEVIRTIREKLITRHPHVFGGKKNLDVDQVMEQWEKLKKIEKSHRESLMDGIPKGLPALSRAYKMAGKMEKLTPEAPFSFSSEEELGELLWEISREAKRLKINPEHALRKTLLDEERRYREWEKNDFF